MNTNVTNIMAALYAATVVASAAEPALIPKPQSLECLPGAFTLSPNTRIYADSPRSDTATFLASRLRQATHWRLKVQRTRQPAEAVSRGIVLTTNGAKATLGAEGYELSVTPSNIVIRAAMDAGMFYGGQSLLQLFPPEIFSLKPARGVDWTIPCVKITDSPRFAWRGLMLDVSRHFFTVAEVKRVLDLMALYKLSVFHWHLVDDQGWRIQIKKYPRLVSVGAWRDGIGFGLDPKSTTAYDRHGRYGGFYTQHDVREIVAYAAQRHITVVPEIEMPGHSSAALAAYPQFLCPGVRIAGLSGQSGVFTGVYCAGNDATFEFIDNVILEVASLFPGKYIHIGGDEVVKSNWVACSRCQGRIQAEGLKDEQELQSYFIRRVEKIVDAHGKQLIGWSEIREGGLAPGAALMDWKGGGTESATSGHDVVMTATKYCYLDHYQSTNRAAEPKAIGGYLPVARVYQFDPIPENLARDSQARILGGQANLWTEYVPNLRHVQYMLLPRLEALAEAVWSPKPAREWDDFRQRAAYNEKRLDTLGVNYRPLSKPD